MTSLQVQIHWFCAERIWRKWIEFEPLREFLKTLIFGFLENPPEKKTSENIIYTANPKVSQFLSEFRYWSII
ncbi:MAG: hypothetical protein CVU46_13530 [Chloroflexi bacterium HGW-Chloroflexi-8]|nr:MAG: hypothetical protein CVU46_13530 [Chloroflexi bacterium HGW-Chloroflexi-8]